MAVLIARSASLEKPYGPLACDRRVWLTKRARSNPHELPRTDWPPLAIARSYSGFLFSMLGAQGITGLNVDSMIVAIIGSVVVLWGYHAVTGR